MRCTPIEILRQFIKNGGKDHQNENKHPFRYILDIVCDIFNKIVAPATLPHSEESSILCKEISNDMGSWITYESKDDEETNISL